MTSETTALESSGSQWLHHSVKHLTICRDLHVVVVGQLVSLRTSGVPIIRLVVLLIIHFLIRFSLQKYVRTYQSSHTFFLNKCCGGSESVGRHGSTLCSLHLNCLSFPKRWCTQKHQHSELLNCKKYGVTQVSLRTCSGKTN